MLRSAVLVGSLASVALGAVANFCVEQPYRGMQEFRDFEPAMSRCAAHYPTQTITKMLPNACLTTTKTIVLGTSTVHATNHLACPTAHLEMRAEESYGKPPGYPPGYAGHESEHRPELNPEYYREHHGGHLPEHHSEHRPELNPEYYAEHHLDRHPEHHHHDHRPSHDSMHRPELNPEYYREHHGGHPPHYRGHHGGHPPHYPGHHPGHPPHYPGHPPHYPGHRPHHPPHYPTPPGYHTHTHHHSMYPRADRQMEKRDAGPTPMPAAVVKRDAMATKSAQWSSYYAGLAECGYDCIQTACSCVASPTVVLQTPAPTCISTITKETMVHETKTIDVAPEQC